MMSIDTPWTNFAAAAHMAWRSGDGVPGPQAAARDDADEQRRGERVSRVLGEGAGAAARAPLAFGGGKAGAPPSMAAWAVASMTAVVPLCAHIFFSANNAVLIEAAKVDGVFPFSPSLLPVLIELGKLVVTVALLGATLGARRYACWHGAAGRALTTR